MKVQTAPTFFGVSVGDPAIVLSKSERDLLRRASLLMQRIADVRGYEDGDEQVIDLMAGSYAAEEIANSDHVEMDA